MDELVNKRVVLITGKGGVGRSVMTAALAKVAAGRGRRVLVTEIAEEGDDYSPLARHWGRERLPRLPEPLELNVQGCALLARTGQELFLKSVLRSATLARAAISSDALRRLLSAGPSFREMGVFFQLLTALRDQTGGGPTHQLILIDMPATGHTLSLTGLPELLLRLVPGGPIAAALKEGQRYLNDPALAAAWVVTLPETLPVSECLELIDGLGKTKMPVGGVVVNRMPADPFTAAEREALTPLVEQYAWLGRELFRKPLVAHRELARLRSHTRLPVFVTPELPHDGLIPALAKLLDGASPMPLVTGGA
ncbi:MAG: arsenic transporter [Myxococcaceae bacterium]|nr:arsenic transporter [Myxococcaceae bacterium]MCA3011255.1 arsenic transporter [Myxococcaceae bacterium]